MDQISRFPFLERKYKTESRKALMEDDYFAKYKASLDDREGFFKSHALRLLEWDTEFSTVYNKKLCGTKWFEGGKINACYNAIDRNCKKNPEKIGIIYSDNEGGFECFTYAEILSRVSEIAGVLKRMGLKKGDCAAVYLPMCAEACFSVLACARLGIVHNVVFGGYSAANLAKRVEDSLAKAIITCHTAKRETKTIDFYEGAKCALDAVQGGSVESVLVFGKGSIKEKLGVRVYAFEEEVVKGERIDCVAVDAEHPLFYLYTSGSTGRPKGVVHATAGYLLYVAMTLETCFSFGEGDVMGCTADLGWITGHSYSLYAPLLLNATTVVLGGSPLFPTELRLFEMVDKLRITHLYTAPTAIRVIKKAFAEKGVDRGLLSNFDTSCLRVLGTVGEPIDRSAHAWFSAVFGNGRLPVVDTYFQTETAGFLIAPTPGTGDFAPECAGLPFFGIDVFIAEKSSTARRIVKAKTGELGILLLRGPWPGMVRGFVGGRKEFGDAYFKKFPGFYFTGDEAFLDENGHVWVRGRIDDVLNISGHRFSTAEIESAICCDEIVDEAAVVGVSDEITGQSIYAFVVCRGRAAQSEVAARVKKTLRNEIGPVVSPKSVILCKSIPKTRTGKIMRRVLRNILMEESVGDVSTCINVESIENLKELAKFMRQASM